MNSQEELMEAFPDLTEAQAAAIFEEIVDQYDNDDMRAACWDHAVDTALEKHNLCLDCGGIHSVSDGCIPDDPIGELEKK